MKQHTLFYGSSYDRGLEHLLFMWEKIREKFPDAELHIAYGWDLFLAAYRDNPERMAWKERMDYLMEQKGITHHGRLGKKALQEVRQQCGVWAYPTHFEEINCITALECQRDGLVPVVTNFAALKETVPAFRVGEDIGKQEDRDSYLLKLLEVMDMSEGNFKLASERAQGFAQSYSWENIAQQWMKEFKK